MLARSLAAAAALAVSAGVARADFATTNAQLLHGGGFRDALLGYDTVGERMTTLTLNHFSTWAWGDNFAFADLYRGDFRDGTESIVYAEWHPRLLLGRALGAKRPLLGILADAGIAFEVNQGPGFYAYLAGVGGDLALPSGTLSVNVYYRYDSVQLPGADVRNHTWQVSPSWGFPFRIGKMALLFTGFVDVSGTDGEDVDVMAQPELLVDVLALAGRSPGRLLAGIEWYLHHNRLNAPHELVSAPQAMLQWNLH